MCRSVAAGYQLEKKTPFGGWEKVSEAPIIGETATVPDLTEGEEYEYRVAAVTDAGVGEYSNATPAVKAERKKRNVQRTCLLTANFHYASWFGAGLEPVRSRFGAGSS